MNNALESLLEDDHRSLGALLDEFDQKLSTRDISRAFELLDFIWARLAVHIRAEHLQLFPALTKGSAGSLADKEGLPTIERAQTVLTTLRADHDFFMKELARAIETMRDMKQKETSLAEIDLLRQRMAIVRERLDNHNRLEEEQVYVWPSLMLDDETATQLFERLRHELENLPPRFRTVK